MIKKKTFLNYKQTFTKQKQMHKLREQIWVVVGEGGARDYWVDWHVHSSVFKIDNLQGPTIYSTGNPVQNTEIT